MGAAWGTHITLVRSYGPVPIHAAHPTARRSTSHVTRQDRYRELLPEAHTQRSNVRPGRRAGLEQGDDAVVDATLLSLGDALGDPHDVPDLLLAELHVGVEHAVVELLLVGLHAPAGLLLVQDLVKHHRLARAQLRAESGGSAFIKGGSKQGCAMARSGATAPTGNLLLTLLKIAWYGGHFSMAALIWSKSSATASSFWPARKGDRESDKRHPRAFM